jgi:hypothetical protein
MSHTMKKLSRLSALSMAVALVSLVAPPCASAEPFLYRYAFTAVFFDECTGEDIEVDGVFISEFIQRVSHEEGNDIIYSRQTYTVHGTGVGLTSGRRYVYNEVLIYSAQSDFESPASYVLRDEALVRTRFISQGAYPDLFAQFSLQCVETPTDLTCDVSVESECHDTGGPSH